MEQNSVTTQLLPRALQSKRRRKEAQEGKQPRTDPTTSELETGRGSLIDVQPEPS